MENPASVYQLRAATPLEYSNGENWTLKRCFRGRGKFRLFDQLRRCPIISANGEAAIYAASQNPEIDVRKIIYFAASIFWRASVWPDKHRSAYQTRLGPKYEEALRMFLLGKADIPTQIVMNVFVCDPETAHLLAYPPVGGRARANPLVHVHHFFIPGICFYLYVGQRMSPEPRYGCLVGAKDAPVMFSNGTYKKLVAKVAKSLALAQPRGILAE